MIIYDYKVRIVDRDVAPSSLQTILTSHGQRADRLISILPHVVYEGLDKRECLLLIFEETTQLDVDFVDKNEQKDS